MSPKNWNSLSSSLSLLSLSLSFSLSLTLFLLSLSHSLSFSLSHFLSPIVCAQGIHQRLTFLACGFFLSISSSSPLISLLFPLSHFPSFSSLSLSFPFFFLSLSFPFFFLSLSHFPSFPLFPLFLKEFFIPCPFVHTKSMEDCTTDDDKEKSNETSVSFE